MRTGILVAMVLAAFHVGSNSAEAANCRDISYAAERSKLQKYFATKGFSKADRAFLLVGIDKRLMEMPKGRLNARGAACGIKAVRAQVLACAIQQLPASLPPSERRTGKALWGETNVSARAALIVGLFHACRGAAMEALFSSK